MKERIERLALPKGRRIIAISDIHGNLPYLKGLLAKLRFNENDILFILGDFVEKGPSSLDTLRYIIELSEKYTVHTICGNCDIWAPLFDGEIGDGAATVLPYMERKPYSLARQMCIEMGIEFSPDMDYKLFRDRVFAEYGREIDFLRGLPTLIDTGDYVFVHGGIPAKTGDAWNYMKYERFMERGEGQERWTIVGHWPVMLYHEDTVEANPIFDWDKKIISIDGGCVLKDDGQLNALIIPESGSFDFSFEAYDSFPTARVNEAQRASEKSWYIRWGDSLVEVLERGEEFSRCRHVRTGYEMDILTKYLYGEGKRCNVNDCTDYVLPLKAGDTVSVVEQTSRGYFVKHRGVSGWYFGEIEWD
ncbi:MAG: serine/threonine protein phosphatase [Ruminococcaceae bacterium]|nr:serine/threonine protein phosphatase [Oscillospiraceae bacterium]